MSYDTIVTEDEAEDYKDKGLSLSGGAFQTKFSQKESSGKLFNHGFYKTNEKVSVSPELRKNGTTITNAGCLFCIAIVLLF